MLRRLIIGTGALGLALVVWGLVRTHNPPVKRPVAPVPLKVLTPTSGPTSRPSLPWMESLTIASGKGLDHGILDDRTGRLQYRLRATEWEPVEGSENEMRLIDPEMIKVMGSGQTLRIAAESGQIVAEPAGKGGLRPKRGTLTGKVRITMDLTSYEWRDSHPDLQGIDQHPEQVVAIEMDSLYFDDDLSLIRTEGKVKVAAAKFDVEATGLKLIYSRVYDRLEFLEVYKGGQVMLRGVGGLDGAGSPIATGPAAPSRQTAGAGTATAPQGEADAAMAAAPQAAASSTAATQARRDEQPSIYQAEFTGPVKVRQHQGKDLVASLDSSKLLWLEFDMDPKDRRQARQGAEDAENPAPATAAGAAPLASTDDGTLNLSWTGTLRIVPKERGPLVKHERTAFLRAVGQVSMTAWEDGPSGQQNTITCEELQYDAIRRSGRILGTGESFAMIQNLQGQYLAGRDISFDHSAGTLEIVGPGEAAEPGLADAMVAADAQAVSPARTTRIQWQKRLFVRFSRTPIEPAFPLYLPRSEAALARSAYGSTWGESAGGAKSAMGGNPLRGLTATSATISGEAVAQLGEDAIRAEALEVTFFPAWGQGRIFGPILAARGSGRVNLSGDDQSISAEELAVQFAMAGAERSIPDSARATGRAVAVQGAARIEADRIIADLSPVAAAEPAEEPAGQASDSQPARPKKRGQEVAVTELIATGAVRIVDPDQSLDSSADHLVASIPGGRRVQVVHLYGREGRRAHVGMKDYTLRAGTILADLEKQDVTVPSEGELDLVVRQNLEGQTLRQPQPMHVRWSKDMRMEGAANQAVFQGDVDARQASQEGGQEDTVVQSDKMTVLFRPVGVAGEAAPAAAQAPIVRNTRQQLREAFPDAGWSTQPREGRAVRPSVEASAQREPVRVIAEGRARTVVSRYAEATKLLTSRLRVEGPVLIADLESRQMEVEGAGNLLIENYAKVTAPPAAAEPDRNRSGFDLSQTVVVWQNAMTFVLDDQMAVFDGKVHMRHLSGSMIVQSIELAQTLGANIDRLRTMTGRTVDLHCDNLRTHFGSAPVKPQAAALPVAAAAGRPQPVSPPSEQLWMQKAQLRNLLADGHVSLHEEGSAGGSNYLRAQELRYSGERDTFVVVGSQTEPATLIRQKDGDSLAVPVSWRSFSWNRKTGEISVIGAVGG